MFILWVLIIGGGSKTSHILAPFVDREYLWVILWIGWQLIIVSLVFLICRMRHIERFWSLIWRMITRLWGCLRIVSVSLLVVKCFWMFGSWRNMEIKSLRPHCMVFLTLEFWFLMPIEMFYIFLRMTKCWWILMRRDLIVIGIGIRK